MTESNRNNQRQIWVDSEFHDRLKKLKALMDFKGIKVNNLGDITKNMIRAESYQNLERELLNCDKKVRINIRMDLRDIFKNE